MQSIRDLLSTLDMSDARSSLYYLSRYLKQAHKFDQYGKDFFEDDVRSAPSLTVKTQTLAIVKMIESSEGVSASQFDDATYGRWATYVAEIESSLQPEATPFQLERANEFVAAISVPLGRRK